MRHRKRKQKSPRSGLAQRIESLSTPSPVDSAVVDGLDSDVLAHVEHFLSTPFPTLEKISLNSREDALQTIAIIEKTKRGLDEKYRTIQMLKSLCEAAKKEEN